MYLTSNKKEECVGCSACANICPYNAIVMNEDIEGFEYPVINKEKCVKCKVCEKICDIKKKKTIFNMESYALKHKDDNIRDESTSGGAFIAISDFILKNKGIVYGAVLDENNNVTHKRADSLEERNQMRKSKYVQSSLGNIFKNVKEDLENDLIVLFVGTPCQIDGLYKFLNKINTEKLYTCDLICHGVPSRRVFRDYIMFISHNGKKSIKDFNFRNKKYGWQSHYETYKKNERYVVNDKYRKLFYSDNILRPSCYSCEYSNLERVGDITIGDCWGIENVDKDFIDKKGISLILINSEKGKKIFENMKNDINYKEININTVLQRNLVKPTLKPMTREKFWEDYNSYKFNKIIKKYSPKKPDKIINKYNYYIHRIIQKIKGA